jgi:Mlc titration factor MtfA (ptsG expression regulator)
VRVFTAAFERHERDVARRRRTLLDDYAAEEPAEFFAAATEAFLESPAAFRAEFPELYDQMREFYHLDPITWASSLDAGHLTGR